MSDQKKVLIVLSGCHSIAIQKKDGSKIEQETGLVTKPNQTYLTPIQS